MYVSLKQLYQLVSVSTKREIAPGSPARTKRSERERHGEREGKERDGGKDGVRLGVRALWVKPREMQGFVYISYTRRIANNLAKFYNIFFVFCFCTALFVSFNLLRYLHTPYYAFLSLSFPLFSSSFFIMVLFRTN